MPADQDLFFDVQPFDRNTIDLKKTATTVEDYMKQVIVERERCSQIVHIDVSKIRPSKKPLRCDVRTDESAKHFSSLAPGALWNEEKSRYFEKERDELEKIEVEPIPDLQLPSVVDRQAWCKLCFEQRLPNFPLKADVADRLAYHAGTPPTLRFVKQLSDNVVNDLLPYQIEYVIEHGYSRPVLQWIFALLLVVKKPLLHDVCSALRDLARQCRAWRAAYTEENMSEILVCSALIAVVSLSFGQRDLKD